MSTPKKTNKLKWTFGIPKDEIQHLSIDGIIEALIPVEPISGKKLKTLKAAGHVIINLNFNQTYDRKLLAEEINKLIKDGLILRG